MKNKIIKIEGCKTCNEVLLFIDRDTEDGTDSIKLIAWHTTEDGEFIQTQQINIEDADFRFLERIINDFSELSASEFANSMVF